MLKDVINKEYLLSIAERLKKKRFRPGFDGMSMDGALSWININGDRLCKDILRKDYNPMPAVGFRIAKHKGSFRSVSSITAIDTVIQKAVSELVTPIAEEKFSDNSFAYRPMRGVDSAIERYISLANEYHYAMKFDFCSCFSDINHSKLEECLNIFFDDELLCDLCIKIAKTPLFIDGEICTAEKGILQGMPLAPVLCNIYLHAADCFLSDLGVPFVRYADDIVVFGTSSEKLAQVSEKIRSFFTDTIYLQCNKNKCKMDSPAKLTFLGYRFSSDKKGIIAQRNNNSVYPDYFWRSETPQNNYRTVDLVSDGILRQKDFSLLFDTETTDTDIPVASTDVINVFSNVILDSGSIEKLMKNNITLNIFSQQGECIGSVVPENPFKDPRMTHKQLVAYYDESQRLALAKDFVAASVHNEIIVIRYYDKQYGEEVFRKVINKLSSLKKSINNATSYEELLIFEAQARSVYYSCFDDIIKNSEFEFESRTRKPPKNMVNSMISFGNTLLYNHIASEIQKTALDVRIGYLHATSSRRKSLNLDVAESFKPIIIDRMIFSLINKNEITPAHFVFSENGSVYLSPEGKNIFLKAFYRKLNVEIKIHGEKMTYRRIITEEIRRLARKFRHDDKYRAYRQVR